MHYIVCIVWIIGRGRPESDSIDDMEDYRVRQPSEPALWDFLSTKFPSVKGWSHFTKPKLGKLNNKKNTPALFILQILIVLFKYLFTDTKHQRPQKFTENQKTDEAQHERPPPRPPPKQESDIQKPKQHKQDSKVEKTENIPPPRQQQGDAQGEYATARDVERPKQETSHQHRDGRQQSKQQREQYYKQQQNTGQAKGKGSRRHDHDSRPYNQSLPPRLQKKQQQQQQQRQQQQQQQHHHQHYQQHSPQQETEVTSDEVEAEYSSAASPPSVAQEDNAIVRFSAVPVSHEYAEESPSQILQPVQFQELQASSYTGQQYPGQAKWQKNYRQGSEQFRPPGFTPPNVQQQQQQHLEFVTMAMESQRSQTQFIVSQPQQFVEQGGREQPQEYQYTQQAQPPVQAYPVYQLRPAQIAQQPMAPQPTIPQQPVATQMSATQVIFYYMYSRHPRYLEPKPFCLGFVCCFSVICYIHVTAYMYFKLDYFESPAITNRV